MACANKYDDSVNIVSGGGDILVEFGTSLDEIYSISTVAKVELARMSSYMGSNTTLASIGLNSS